MARATQSPLMVVEGSEQAAALLHPLRRQILEALREPESASGLARLIGLPRQKINYHLRELERHRFVAFVKERRRGNCVERIYRSTARAYVISPETTGALAADPEAIRDRFSSSYLTALAARATRDLGRLRSRAKRAGKRLATISLQAEVRFASAVARAGFAEELSEALKTLIGKYHDENASGGRRFTFIVGGYPKIGEPEAGGTTGAQGPDGSERAGRPSVDSQPAGAGSDTSPMPSRKDGRRSRKSRSADGRKRGPTTNPSREGRKAGLGSATNWIPGGPKTGRRAAARRTARPEEADARGTRRPSRTQTSRRERGKE